VSVERGQVDDKLSRYRSLMKNKKKNIKNQSQMEDDPDDVDYNPKLKKTDVRKIMEDHRNILEREQKDDYEEYGEKQVEPRKMSKKQSKSKRKKKPVNDEDMVKMLYFKKYASKSKWERSYLTNRGDWKREKIKKSRNQKKKIRI
jgi:hypothetical protein